MRSNTCSASSDHAPLHVMCKTAGENVVKSFKFQKFWTKQKGFKSIIQNNWVANFIGSLFLEMQANLKKVKKALLDWSKSEFSNIFVKKSNTARYDIC